MNSELRGRGRALLGSSGLGLNNGWIVIASSDVK